MSITKLIGRAKANEDYDAGIITGEELAKAIAPAPAEIKMMGTDLQTARDATVRELQKQEATEKRIDAEIKRLSRELANTRVAVKALKASIDVYNAAKPIPAPGIPDGVSQPLVAPPMPKAGFPIQEYKTAVDEANK